MDGWIAPVTGQPGYVGIALLMLLDAGFPPIPSEIIMPLAGMGAACGSPSPVGVIVSGSAGR